MKGATAEPSLKIINPPKSNKRIMIGSSQNFFLTLKKLINSIINDIIKIDFSLNL